MRRVSKLLSFILCFCFLFSACGKQNEIFFYYINAIPNSLDPQIATTPEELSVVSGLFDGLFSMNAQGEPILQAAESYEVSNSGLVYTFYLKKDLAYRYQTSLQEEQPAYYVTADDYVFGLQRVFMPATLSPHTTTFSAIQNAGAVLEGANPTTLGVKALDDYTLQITLSHPDTEFLHALTTAGAMPCNRAFFEATGGAYGLSRNNLICNGPYDLRTWNETDGVTLTAVDETSPVERIRLPILADDVAPIEYLKRGDADACIVTRGTADDFANYHTTELNTTTWVLLMNPHSAGLQNEGLRQGLAGSARLTVDGIVLETGFSNAHGLIPPSVSIQGHSYRDANGSALPSYSLQGAQRFYQDGLVQQGLDKLNNIRVVAPVEQPYNSLLDSINQDWQKNLNAFFSLDKKPSTEVIAAVVSGDYDIALLPISAFSSDVYALLLPYENSPDWGVIGRDNTAFLNAMQPLSATTYNREPLFLTAEKALLQDAVITPLFFESSLFVTAKWVKSLYVSPFGPLIDFHSFVT